MFNSDWEVFMQVLCENEIQKICEDILKKGNMTRYPKIYDVIFDAIKDEIENSALKESDEATLSKREGYA